MRGFSGTDERVKCTESILTHPAHADGLVNSSDPVGIGAASVPGVAEIDALASTDIIPVVIRGAHRLQVRGSSGTVGAAVTEGDKLFLVQSGSDTKATQTLTSTGTAPANNDTVTIDGQVYTFKTALSSGPTVPYEVLIGGSAAIALDNLKAAINDTGVEGTNYSVGTAPHPTVTATTNTDTTQVVEAKLTGAGENSIATTETSAQLSWGAATLAGGVDGAGVLNKASGSKPYGVALGAVASRAWTTIPVLLEKAI